MHVLHGLPCSWELHQLIGFPATGMHTIQLGLRVLHLKGFSTWEAADPGSQQHPTTVDATTGCGWNLPTPGVHEAPGLGDHGCHDVPAMGVHEDLTPGSPWAEGAQSCKLASFWCMGSRGHAAWQKAWLHGSCIRSHRTFTCVHRTVLWVMKK